MGATEDMIATLKKLAKKEQNVKLRQRYDVICLFLQGHHEKEVASIMNLSLSTIYSILKTYSEKGTKRTRRTKRTQELVPSHSTIRRKKLTEEQETYLFEVISEKSPNEVELAPSCTWTAPLACQFVKKEFNVDFSERGMRNLVGRLGLNCMRPYIFAKADSEKQENFREDTEAFKKTSE